MLDAVRAPLKNIHGVSQPKFDFNGIDQLSVTMTGWSPTLHTRRLRIDLDVERIAANNHGIACHHDGTPVDLDQQALIAVVAGHAARFGAAQRAIAAIALRMGLLEPMRRKRTTMPAIGHLEMETCVLDALVAQRGVDDAARHIAWVHGELLAHDGGDAQSEGGEYGAEPSMEPDQIFMDEIGYNENVSAKLHCRDGVPALDMSVMLMDDEDHEVGEIWDANLSISTSRVRLPEAVVAALPGRRLGDVMSITPETDDLVIEKVEGDEHWTNINFERRRAMLRNHPALGGRFPLPDKMER